MKRITFRRRLALWAIPAIALVFAIPSTSSAISFAVWLDGNTTPGGGGNGIVSSLDNAFGAASVTLVSTPELETPGFLDGFNSVIVSRFDSGFGSSLSALAASNIAAYVDSGPSQGGVALFTNDVADNLFGAATGDPYDPNLNQLFVNAATFAADSGHGYIGEFNGAVMAMSSNSAGMSAIGLLPGSASATYYAGNVVPGGKFIYNVGPIGGSNPIDAGVTFPFTDSDVTIFRTDISGAASGNIVDVYADNGLPAVLANSEVINGGGGGSVPDGGNTLLLLGGSIVALAIGKRGGRVWRSLSCSCS